MQQGLAKTVFEKVSLFSGLSSSELTILAQHASIRTYPKNTIVINEGDEANALYVVISGQVIVFQSNQEGREIIVNMQGPCEHFGELALLDSTPRSASVMTTEKTKLAIVSKPDFQRMLAEHPGIALSLIRDLTKRVRVLSENVKSLALLDVYGRVAKTLLAMASDRDGTLIVEKRLTQQDIANRVGASREMVARILKDLTTGGYISVANRHIVINEKLPERY